MTYANACTIKVSLSARCLLLSLELPQHGSFGGPASGLDEYFCTGSDDFRTYCWRIPDLARLADERKEIGSGEWADALPRSTGDNLNRV